MVLPGHLAGGYLAAQLVLAIGHPAFSGPEVAALSLIGILAGELPDIDLVWLNLQHRRHASGVRKHTPTTNHREYITHVPFFWLIVSFLVVTLGAVADSMFTQYVGWIILAGTWSHFLLDSIEHGVPWLSPFSHKRFCLKDKPEVPLNNKPGTLASHWEFITKHYTKNITFFAEILIVVVAVAGWYILK